MRLLGGWEGDGHASRLLHPCPDCWSNHWRGVRQGGKLLPHCSIFLPCAIYGPSGACGAWSGASIQSLVKDESPDSCSWESGVHPPTQMKSGAEWFSRQYHRGSISTESRGGQRYLRISLHASASSDIPMLIFHQMCLSTRVGSCGTPIALTAGEQGQLSCGGRWRKRALGWHHSWR